MPRLDKLKKQEDCIFAATLNNHAIHSFLLDKAYRSIQDDLLQRICGRLPKEGEKWDDRKHGVPASRIRLFKGLCYVFALTGDLLPRRYINRFDSNLEFRRISYEEIARFTKLNKWGIKAGLREFEAAGIITRKSPRGKNEQDQWCRALWLRFNGGKLCQLASLCLDNKAQRAVNLPSFNKEKSIGPCSISPSSASPVEVPTAEQSGSAQGTKSPVARARSRMARGLKNLETEDFKQAIARLQTVFPDKAIPPKARRKFLMSHRYDLGHQQFNLDRVNQWLEGIEMSSNAFPVDFETPWELAESWRWVTDEMNRYRLMPKVNARPSTPIPTPEEAKDLLDYSARISAVDLNNTRRIRPEYTPDELWSTVIPGNPVETLVSRFYLAHQIDPARLAGLTATYGAELRADFKKEPFFYCSLLALNIDPKNWTDNPSQFDFEMQQVVPAALRTTARRNEAAKVWGMSEGQKYDY